MVIIAIHTDTVRQPNDMAACLAVLSDDRRQRAMRLTRLVDRQLSVCAGLALDTCLQTIGLREKTTVLRREPGGRPVLGEHPQWHFSLSHSGDWAVCALANSLVGVDVEKYRPIRVLTLARRYFLPAETAWLESLPEPERNRAFFRLWTAKESYLKAQGLGLPALQSLSITAGSFLLGPPPWRFCEYPLPGYQLTVCGTPPFPETVRQIFSYNSDLLR